MTCPIVFKAVVKSLLMIQKFMIQLIMRVDIRLQKGSDLWNLYFNVTKCKILHIGKNNQEIDYKMKLSEDKLMTNSKMRRGEGSRCYFR